MRVSAPRFFPLSPLLEYQMADFVKPLKTGGEFAATDRSCNDLMIDIVNNNLPVGSPAGLNDIDAGAVLRISSTTPAGNRPNVVLAQGDSKANAQSVCIAVETIPENNGTGKAQFGGIVDLPTATWDNVLPVTERGAGLNPGKEYFIDPANPGFLTEVAPNSSGDERAPIGEALTPQKLKYLKQPTETQT